MLYTIGGSFMVKVVGIAKQKPTVSAQTIPVRIEQTIGGFVIKVEITPIMLESPANITIPQSVEPVEQVPAHLGKVSIPLAEIEKVPVKPAEKKSQFVGATGERTVFKLTLLRVKQRRVGTTTEYFYKFHDPDGNLIMWSTHRDKRMLTGNEYNIKATIRDHMVQRNENITMVTRGRVIE